jgi:hypothetical protein
MLTFNVSNNYWERNGTAHPGPNLGDAHFCPPWMFTSTGTAQTECLTPLESTGPGSEAAYFEAASLESGEDIESAHSAFANIIETYPESPEAIWSTRGLLRTGLAHGISAIQNHDSLLDNYNNESLSEQVRQAARREAVWALIAGGRFADARTELSAIEFDPNAGEDSVWAVVTTEVVNLLDVGAGAYRVGAQASGMSKRITDFHNRLHQIMGRAEDSVIESEAVTPQSHLIATAYPNPFNNSVTIQLQLTEAGPLKLRIFNLLGQEVEMLADKPFEAGTHRFDWNGASSPSGVYFYRVEQNGHIQSHKLMLLK